MELPEEHGTRSWYVRKKCRCDACKKANREYAIDRAKRIKELATLTPLPTQQGAKLWTSKLGKKYVRIQTRMCTGRDGKGCPRRRYLKKDSKGTLCDFCREGLLSAYQHVDTVAMREHIKKLSKAGIGRRELSALSGVAENSISLVSAGHRKKVDRDTEAAVLAIAMPHGVGRRKPDEACENCGLSHGMKHRLLRLSQLLPCTIQEACEAYPCVYPRVKHKGKDVAENRMVYRDLHSLGAADREGIWSLPEQNGPIPRYERVAEKHPSHTGHMA